MPLIKLILALLLFLCLADMPYGYFQFVRFASCIVFAYSAYAAYENRQEATALIYLGLALLFQPFIKIALGRELWNVVDVVVGVGLIFSLFQKEHRT